MSQGLSVFRGSDPKNILQSALKMQGWLQQDPTRRQGLQIDLLINSSLSQRPGIEIVAAVLLNISNVVTYLCLPVLVDIRTASNQRRGRHTISCSVVLFLMTCHRSETTIPEFLVLIDLEAKGSDKIYEWREHLSSLEYALESWASDCKLAPRTLLTDDAELVNLGQSWQEKSRSDNRQSYKNVSLTGGRTCCVRHYFCTI
jgi:hypothetical protein